MANVVWPPYRIPSQRQVDTPPLPLHLPREGRRAQWHYVVDLDRARLLVHSMAGERRDFPLNQAPRGRVFNGLLRQQASFGADGAVPDAERGFFAVTTDATALGLVLSPDAEPVSLRVKRVAHIVGPGKRCGHPNANLALRRLLLNRLAARYDALLRSTSRASRRTTLPTASSPTPFSASLLATFRW